MTQTKNRGCARKVRHPSYEQAHAHLMHKVRWGAYMPRLNVYACRFCDGWHVGFRPRRRR